MEYIAIPSGSNQRLNSEQLDKKITSVIRKMLEDFKHASPHLKKKLKDWEYFDYFDDLKGDVKKIKQVEIARELFFQAYTSSKALKVMDFREDFWIHFTILIFYKYVAKDCSLTYESWLDSAQWLYTHISTKYPWSTDQKEFCMKVYKANYSMIDDSSEFNQLWESLKKN